MESERCGAYRGTHMEGLAVGMANWGRQSMQHRGQKWQHWEGQRTQRSRDSCRDEELGERQKGTPAHALRIAEEKEEEKLETGVGRGIRSGMELCRHTPRQRYCAGHWRERAQENGAGVGDRVRETEIHRRSQDLSVDSAQSQKMQ